MITIELPWPHPALAPNRSSGKHWANLAAIKAKAKADAYYTTRAAMRFEAFDTEKRYPLEIVFHAPDNRRRDLDGLLSSVKHALDGVAKAMGIDDSQFGPVTLDYHKGCVQGLVIVRVVA